MTNEEYIKTHPEQFKDDIDKWLFMEFGIIGGCCSSIGSLKYIVAREVAEKLTDAFIKKACSWLENNLQGIVGGSIYIEDFRKAMKL